MLRRDVTLAFSGSVSPQGTRKDRVPSAETTRWVVSSVPEKRFRLVFIFNNLCYFNVIPTGQWSEPMTSFKIKPVFKRGRKLEEIQE